MTGSLAGMHAYTWCATLVQLLSPRQAAASCSPVLDGQHCASPHVCIVVGVYVLIHQRQLVKGWEVLWWRCARRDTQTVTEWRRVGAGSAVGVLVPLMLLVHSAGKLEEECCWLRKLARNHRRRTCRFVRVLASISVWRQA